MIYTMLGQASLTYVDNGPQMTISDGCTTPASTELAHADATVVSYVDFATAYAAVHATTWHFQHNWCERVVNSTKEKQHI